jgi:hypothetical protein
VLQHPNRPFTRVTATAWMMPFRSSRFVPPVELKITVLPFARRFGRLCVVEDNIRGQVRSPKFPDGLASRIDLAHKLPPSFCVLTPILKYFTRVNEMLVDIVVSH